MNKLTSFIHFHGSKATTLDVILHGSSGGIDSTFMQKLFENSKNKGNSVIMFNFPFLERGEEHSSCPELKEELQILREMLQIAGSRKFTYIRLIGKSLGGIIASYYVNTLTEDERKLYEVVILGYVTGDVKLKKFGGKITIIQGGKDKFGDTGTVKKDMDGAISKDITYHEISNANHGYRDPDTKEPIYEDKVIELLSSL